MPCLETLRLRTSPTPVLLTPCTGVRFVGLPQCNRDSPRSMESVSFASLLSWWDARHGNRRASCLVPHILDLPGAGAYTTKRFGPGSTAAAISPACRWVRDIGEPRSARCTPGATPHPANRRDRSTTLLRLPLGSPSVVLALLTSSRLRSALRYLLATPSPFPHVSRPGALACIHNHSCQSGIRDGASNGALGARPTTAV
jgi:hypothetical protein